MSLEKIKVVIVEDERGSAMDLKYKLVNLANGYPATRFDDYVLLSPDSCAVHSRSGARTTMRERHTPFRRVRRRRLYRQGRHTEMPDAARRGRPARGRHVLRAATARCRVGPREPD